MKVITFGELLLRLAAPGYTRLLQKDSFDATFCGGEANVAVSLANFGVESAFITKLPQNEIGQAAVCSLRYFNVDTSKVLFDNGRMGLYYLEKGASQRPSKVIYDRKYSSFALAKRKDFDWNSIFKDAQWFHWTGITPALSDELILICEDACIAAKSLNMTVSCDLNYRRKLWMPDKARTVMKSLLKYVDVCICNEEDAEQALGIKPNESNVENGTLNVSDYIQTAKTISSVYGCKYVATTLRRSYSASRNGWRAMLYSGRDKTAHFSDEYDIQIVDRVGAGDSFAAALIYALGKEMKLDDTIAFATAASCLKHTIEGDFNRSSVDDVERLINNGGNGRVVR